MTSSKDERRRVAQILADAARVLDEAPAENDSLTTRLLKATSIDEAIDVALLTPPESFHYTHYALLDIYFKTADGPPPDRYTAPVELLEKAEKLDRRIAAVEHHVYPATIRGAAHGRTLEQIEEEVTTTAKVPGNVPSLAPKVKPEPPLNACYFLSLVLSPCDRQAIVGDLNQEYWTYIVPEFGERRARLWFWTQTAKSIVPIVSRRVVKLAAGLATWKAVTSIVQRLVG